VVKKILDRDFPAIPDVNFSTVDVRDVAAAHLAAMTHPAAPGRRFLMGEGNHSMREIARILADHLGPKGFRVPTGPLPGFVLRVLALWDQTARLALHDLGTTQQIDSTPVRDVLGIPLRGLSAMVTDMADSMVAFGVVRAR
jgi:dihydroflavonol-4-reductase